MVSARIPSLGLIFLASVSSAIFVRDVDGNWRSLKRSARGEVLTLPLTNHNDQSYSVPVQMGTPFQEVPMAISLSQDQILVQSASSDNTEETGFYNPSQSSSFLPGNTTIAVTDSEGQTATASFAAESCQVASFGYDASVAITPPSANANTKLYPKGCHGVLGYGVNLAPGTPNSTLLNVYLPVNLTSAVCGIELNWAGDQNQGIFTMGDVDSTAFTGDFTTMIVPDGTSIERPSWSIPVDAIFASVDNGVEAIAGSLASIDPYYPTIQIPDGAAALLYSKISKAAVSSSNPNRYTVPCNANIQLTLTFGGKNFTMNSRDGVLNENGTCYGVVEATSGNLYKIGSPFMRNVYTSFGVNVTTTGAVFNVAFANKVIRPGSAATSAGAANTPSVVFMVLVCACISMIVA